MVDEELVYLSKADVLFLHERIVEADEKTEPGVSTPGDVEFAVTSVREGHFGAGPVTIHEKAAHLLRLLTANHPFVDGNKRTALVSTVSFYALNGYSLDYGNEIRSLLRRLATDESSVSTEELVAYLEATSKELSTEQRTKYHALLDRSLEEDGRQNDYTDEAER